ncbi:MAG: zf-HC2 domain-containing protein [Chloroflexi bacterium]|nr:zf-HC2 domain-containing protein [Chloroflexota bacterium]
MSTCQRTRQWLSPYIDDRLSEDERQSVDKHLKECVACRADLLSLQRTAALLRDLPQMPVPRPLTVTVAAISRPSLVPLLRPATALAAMALFAVLTTDFLTHTIEPNPRGGIAPIAPAIVADEEGVSGSRTPGPKVETREYKGSLGVAGALTPATGAPVLPYAEPRTPATPAGTSPTPSLTSGPSLPTIRLAEIGLLSLVTVLAGALVLARRWGRR